VGLADNATVADFAQAQALVDNFTIECTQHGFPLPELTLPGQNSSRTLATASQTSVKTVSQITVSAASISLLPTPTFSQMTVTSLPPAAPGPSTASPTTSTNTGAAAHNNAKFGMISLSLMVAGWMVF